MNARRIHIVGIGGIGLSAIARVLIARGVQVSGSDPQTSPITDELAKAGARIYGEQRAENVADVDLVLVTSAAPAHNPEVMEARRRGIPIVKRLDFFPELTAGYKTIAVSGTHGKTTTTGMITTILADAGLDPTAIIGGMIPELNGNARVGRGEYFVVEADEYDRAFLGLHPTIAVVTSIEMDHPDIYRNLQEVANAFGEFVNLVSPEGLVVGCGDAEQVARELKHARAATWRYGFGPENEWRATDVRPADQGGSHFRVSYQKRQIGDFSLQIPGRHNVMNALAALAVASHIGIDLKKAGRTLATFQGAARRFQVKGEFGGITIVDDYAHHPSEIRATLEAARVRYPKRTLWAVFQPHTFSRTRALLDDFARAFADADHVIVTEIFAAREHDSMGTSGAQIVERMTHPDARFIPDLGRVEDFLQERVKAGDVLITLGAGDVYRVGVQLAFRLQGDRDV